MPQFSRLVIVFLFLIFGLLLVRHFLVPETVCELGHYRSAAIDSEAGKPTRDAGHQACMVID